MAGKPPVTTRTTSAAPAGGSTPSSSTPSTTASSRSATSSSNLRRPMSERYDVLVVGAGHNGLVAGSYLAKAGRKVLVVERSGAPGGLARSDFLIPEAPNHMINSGAIELIHVRASPILPELEL